MTLVLASLSRLIDFHPSYPSLLLATGGSGHAFKFLPVLGRAVLGRLNGTLSPHEASIWSFHGCPERIDKSRGESVLVRGTLELDPRLQARDMRDVVKARL